MLEFEEPEVYIQAAITAAPDRSLPLREFVNHSGFPIQSVFVDRFFHSLKRGRKAYVNQEMLKYLGYTAELERENKKCFLKAVKSNGFALDKDYWIYNNATYLEIYNELVEKSVGLEAGGKPRVLNAPRNPDEKSDEENSRVLNAPRNSEEKINEENSRGNVAPRNSEEKTDGTAYMEALGFVHPSEFIGVHGKNAAEHLVMNSMVLKEMMMIIGRKSPQVRRYYMMLEYLTETYAAYQVAFSEQQNANLLIANSGLQSSVATLLHKVDELSVELREERKERREDAAILKKQNEVNSHKLDLTNENMIGVLGHLGVVSSYHVPPGRIPAKNSESLWIVHVPGSVLPYHVFRAQEHLCEQSFGKLLDTNPGVKEIRVFRNHPNPREEFICFRKRAGRNIFCRNNKFYLNDGFTEADLIQLLDLVHAEKMEKYEKEVVRLQDDIETDEDEEQEEQQPVDAEQEEQQPVDAEDADNDESPDEELYTREILCSKTMPELKDIARTSGGSRWSKLPKVGLVEWIVEYFNR